MKKLYSALMTAFNEDGSVNLDGVREMVRYNIDVNHIDGLYVGGLFFYFQNNKTAV